MATRFRLPSSGSVTVTPSIQSYTHTGSTRAPLATADTSALTTIAFTPDATDHLVSGDTFFSQFVSDGLSAGITFTLGDAISCAVQGLESNSADNLFLQVYAAIVSNDGTTVQRVLLAKTADNTEYSTTLTSRTFTSTQSGATYTTTVGDRLVVELSVSGTPSAAGGVQGHNASLRFGSDGAGGDLLGNDTDTGTTLNPWIDFAPTITFQSNTPFLPLDWPTARITYHPTSLRTALNGPLGGATLPTFPPPSPVVDRAHYPASLRTFANATRFYYIDPALGVGGFPSYDWPNPKAATFPDSLRTALVNLSESTLQPAGSVVSPFVPVDAPIPAPRVYSTVLRTALSGPLGPDVSTTFPPFQSELFARPIHPIYPNALRTFSFFYVPDTTVRNPFVQSEMRVVPRAAYRMNLRTDLSSFRDILADHVFGLAAPSYDWPNPKAATFPIALRTMLTNGSRYQYVDTIYRGAGQVPSYDWPNPKQPTFPITLRSALSSLAWFYSVAFPKPFIQTDWPNPKQPARVKDLFTALGWMPLELIGKDTFYGAPGEPPRAQLWPNPQAPVYPNDLRSVFTRFIARTFRPQWASQSNRVVGPIPQEPEL